LCRDLAQEAVAHKVATDESKTLSLLQNTLLEYAHHVGQCVHAGLKQSNLATDGSAKTPWIFMPQSIFDRVWRPFVAKFTAFQPSRQGKRIYSVLTDTKALQAVFDSGFLSASFGPAGPEAIIATVICEEPRPFRIVYCTERNMLRCEYVYEAKHADGRFCVQAKQRLLAQKKP
jgi:hypothetical protein